MVANRKAGRSLTGVAFAVLLLAACGGTGDDAGRTPGYQPPSNTPDTSPFEMARPDADPSASTIPDGGAPGVGSLPEDATSTSTTTTTPPPPSTTTTAVGALVAPSASGITSICGFEATIAPFEKLPDAAPAQVPFLMASLLTAMDRYAAVVPPEFRQDVRSISDDMRGLRDLLDVNGNDPKSPAYLAAFAKARNEAEEPGSLGYRVYRVVGEEHARCG